MLLSIKIRWIELRIRPNLAVHCSFSMGDFRQFVVYTLATLAICGSFGLLHVSDAIAEREQYMLDLLFSGTFFCSCTKLIRAQGYAAEGYLLHVDLIRMALKCDGDLL